MDYDSDSFFITNNSVLLRNTRATLTVMCIQKKAEKQVITEKLLEESDLKAFGNDVGKVTNRVTSQKCLQDNFLPDSKEYKELDYRIICGQKAQQDTIDSVKGIKVNKMPSYWFNNRSLQVEDSDTDEMKKRKEFLYSICATKKPYFMCYRYNEIMKEYIKFIKGTELNCYRKFHKSFKDILSADTLSDEELTEKDYFYKFVPVYCYPSVCNKICWKIENEFDGYKEQNNENSFDYSILKSDLDKDIAHEDYRKLEMKVSALCKEFLLLKEEYRKAHSDDKHDEDYNKNLKQFADNYLYKCIQVCGDKETLCNIIVDCAYSNDLKSNKKIHKSCAWELCGDVIINNLLMKNNNQIYYPCADDNGDIQFDGELFLMKKITLEGE